MKATALLRHQHRRLERLLVRLGGEQHLRMQLTLQLVEELLTHLSLEDTFFLCPIADKLGVRVDNYREEQALVRNAVLQTVFAEEDTDLFADRLRELTTVFEQHACAIERDLFPLVESHARADELEAIGRRMQAFWNAAVAGETAPGSALVQAAE
jgi:hypothetical protein